MKRCGYKYCGKEFTGRPNKRFCSNTCRTYHSHGNTTAPGWQERARIANAPASKIWVKTCPTTKLLFIARIPQSKFHPSLSVLTYHEKTHVPVAKAELICIDCSGPFTATNRLTPPQRCKECAGREQRRVIRSQRRARIRNTVRETVVPFRVFTRDQWTCQCCGIPTPKELRGTINPNAPELDHIIPLSKGGVHSYKNTQCLCRQCNNIKGDKVTSSSTAITATRIPVPGVNVLGLYAEPRSIDFLLSNLNYKGGLKL